MSGAHHLLGRTTGVATGIDIHDGSSGDEAFKVERRGIDYVPENERWATPRNIAALWAGTSINVEYFIYGALLMGFGFSFYTALAVIIIGNVSYFLLGLASLQGPETGTTAFMISRAPFGTRGSRLLSFFNWITQLGFETEGLILIVGAGLVLSQMAGLHTSSGLKVAYVIIAAAIQAVLSGREIEIYGAQGTIRDFIHVTDIATGIVAALEKGKEGTIYNIGTGRGTSTRQLVSMLESLAQNDGLSVRSKILPSRQFDVEANVLDSSKLTAHSGWVPKASLGIGVEEMWHAVKSR